VIVAVGGRANVVKVAPLLPALTSSGIDVQVAYAGVREDALDYGSGFTSVYGVIIPAPTWYLDSGIGSSAAATGVAMRSFEQLFAVERPDAVLLAGDVNGTLAAAISAAKAGLPVVHVEAGIRCGDLSYPDEVNRVLISRVAAMHLTPSARALENLEDEGIEPERIHFVGNAVAEQALRELDHAPGAGVVEAMGRSPRGYVLAVFHRPDHLADRQWLAAVVEGLSDVQPPVLMPDSDAFVSACELFGIAIPASIQTTPPIDHLKMLSLIKDSACVVTDSGGLQEEACVLCAPCVTVRGCTEHVETLTTRANVLAAAEAEVIRTATLAAVSGRRQWVQPARWDRAVSDRVVRALRRGIMPLR